MNNNTVTESNVVISNRLASLRVHQGVRNNESERDTVNEQETVSENEMVINGGDKYMTANEAVIVTVNEAKLCRNFKNSKRTYSFLKTFFLKIS